MQSELQLTNLISQKVRYRGYSFAIEATIIDARTEQRGSIAVTEVLLETAAGIRMWRGLGDCTFVDTPVTVDVELFDEIEVTDPDGQVYYGTVIDVTESDVCLRTDDGWLVEADRRYITRIFPAQQMAWAG